MPLNLLVKKPQVDARNFVRRTVVLAGFICFLMLLLLVRLVYLQWINHSRYTTLAKQNHLKVVPIAPTRGLIYDSNGVLLAKNQVVYDLTLIPEQVPDIPETLAQLREIISWEDVLEERFWQTLKQRRRFHSVVIKSKLTEEEVAKFSLERYRFPGVSIEAKLLREYLLAEDLAHVIGYVGRISPIELASIDQTNYAATEFIGKAGIEQAYEHLLHGTVGFQQVETDASGRIVRTLGQKAALPGKNIYLTIDSRLQQVANKALAGEKGAVVALQPQTGGILALASMPTYDPNLFTLSLTKEQYEKLSKSPDQPLYNRAIHGQYSPGSTIKVFHALHGLDLGLVESNEYFYDPGWFQLEGSHQRFRGWKRSGHGWVNLHKAIVESAGSYFYRVAFNLGVRQLVMGLQRFGFGQPSGIDLPNERVGLLPTPEWKQGTYQETWYAGDTLVLGIGQGYLLTTPLQLAVATSYIANRGYAWQPHLLHLIENPQGNLSIYRAKALPEIKLDPRHWQTVIKAMQGVIKERAGTGGRSFGRDTPYTVAGKTGTTQVYRLPAEGEQALDQIPKHLRDHSLFIGFAPVEEPKIVVAVVVENNNKAVAIARQIMDAYLLDSAPSS